MPCLNYADAKKSMQWLCDAFGFRVKASYEDENGKIAHAELEYKGNLIMLGSADSGTPFSKLVTQPNRANGLETQAPYVFIDPVDIDRHYETAKKYGARIQMDLEEQSYGGKNYTCYDPEGHLWSFGSYDPWAGNEE